MVRDLREKYSPLYFLGSLGYGGMAVTFFIYLTFSVPHKGKPIVVFENWTSIFAHVPIWRQALIVFALVGILFFVAMHLRLLFWNIREYRLFKQTDAFKQLINSNAEVTIMAIPLTLAMTVNVLFIIGAVFVPHLWSVVDYLFPFSLAGFLLTGYYALSIFGKYYQRLLTQGNFNFKANNNMSQMTSILAFTMSGVGLAAVGAMSHSSIVYGIGMFGAIFFVVTSIMLAILQGVQGFTSMMEHGISEEMTPSLWIAIPILTLLGITTVRLYLGSMHNLMETHHPDYAPLFMVTSIVVAMQIMSGVVGYRVMKQFKYFDKYVWGQEKSVVSLSLICPGVSSFVFGMFFIIVGLVKNGIFPMFSVPFWIMVVPYVAIWMMTIVVLWRLTRKLFYQTA